MQLGDKKLLVQRASVGSKNATLVSVTGRDGREPALAFPEMSVCEEVEDAQVWDE